MRTGLASLIAALTVLTAGSYGAAETLGAALAKPTLTVRKSTFGPILFDGTGHALYAFTKDPRRGRSTCYGACAAAWPPYLKTGTLRAGPGTHRSLIGTTRRRNGRLQITYAGRPLYFYVGDRQVGQVLCQNVREFGGLWLVQRPTGALVR
jgi:predicted lipoprotein with Yx(FWY)xxD motif